MSDQQPRSEKPNEQHESRLQLIWDVVIFQFKLAADGLRDLLLSPVSIISAIVGLLAGGDEPDRYFKKVLKLGRRSELWLNLFGHHRRSNTSDDLVKPIQERIFSEAQNNPWLAKAGSGINRTLDGVNASVAAKQASRDSED
ncbi:MAG: hypothetical protein O7E57_18150 [Gammaproteobacteria bacterium]|nr:hypothetical protein [Gammaproteobacteria bacterium]